MKYTVVFFVRISPLIFILSQALTPTQVLTNRVSTIVKNRSSGISGQQVRSQHLFIKPPEQRGNNHVDAACSMSISLSPSHKQPPVLPLTGLPKMGNSGKTGNESISLTGKDSVEVISVSPPVTNFKNPLPKQHVNTLKERLKSSVAKSKASSSSNAVGCQYYPTTSNIANNNIQPNHKATSYVQLSASVQSSASTDQAFTPAAKRIMGRRPSKPIKKVGAKGKEL